MFAGLKRRLGLVDVSATPTYIVVEGISTLSLMKDMYRLWGSNVVYKNMFLNVKTSEFRVRHFFGPYLKYIIQTLYEDKQTRLPKRVLGKVLDEMNANTWLGQIDKDVESITDMKVIDKVVTFPLKPFQREFAQIFGKMVPAHRLRGYMLDAGPGTGKTVTDLVIAAALHASKVIIVTPKNAAERVWEATINDIVLEKRPYWLSTGNETPKTSDYYFICHYEQLEQMLEFVKANPKDFKNTFVILDESHNFNRLASDRTQYFVELCQLPQVSYNLWASGTPIQALGNECIPYLKCTDPMFDSYCEEAFRKIWGRDAKRANDILRWRIGHLKYHVPQQDVVSTKVNVEVVKVKMPNAEDYTLENIGKILREFIDKRIKYYNDNRQKYVNQYHAGLDKFKKSLKTDAEKKQFAAYESAIKIVSSGFDPRTMKAEAQLCNQYELKTIIPFLDNPMKNEFKSARSVVKYVNLKIMGEALGSIVGGMRSKCHMEMVEHIDFSKYIDQAEKKTLIFTSYVDVLEKVADLIDSQGYTSGRVYGATNKDLSSIIAQFYKDEDLNPLAATYQSLSTAVPLTAANTILMINQPFRDAIRTQTIARANRLGQDKDVWVFDFLLDTGDKPNISTRSNDILQWSQSQVSQILGVDNVDVDTLSLESFEDYSPEVIGWIEDGVNLLADLIGIGKWLDSMGIRSGHLEGQGRMGWRKEAYSKESVMGFSLPTYLYHGSAFKQDELMPGFQRSGTLVRWDSIESNEWLYSTADRDEAIILGLGSALEKVANIDRFHSDLKTKKIVITSPDNINIDTLRKLQLYLYTIAAEGEDGWIPNYNKQNGIDNEYKTQNVVENIAKCEKVDLFRLLAQYRVEFVKSTPEYSTEAFGQMMTNLKKMILGDDRQSKKDHLPTKPWMTDKEVKAVETYISDYFGNAAWLSKQQFNTTVSSSGIIQPLSYDGKFPTSGELNAIEGYISDYKTKAGKFNGWLTSMNNAAQATYKKFEGPILAAIKADDRDKFEELAKAACKAFADIDAPMFKMPETKVIGGRRVFVKSHPTSPFDKKAISAEEVKVTSPATIPALDKAGMLKAAGIVKEMLKMESQMSFYRPWLDFEDDSDFSNKIHEYDEDWYMNFYDQYYFQTIDNNVIGGFPTPRHVSGQVVLALLAWMDRSVKD